MPDFMQQLQRRLVELGCPGGKLGRMLQEVADHRDDLKQAALAEGLSGTDAEARAHLQLGNPQDLAEHLMVVLRRSSWWGRHSLLGFLVLPLLVFPVLWSLFMALLLMLEFALGYGFNSKHLQVAAQNPVIFHYWFMAFHSADYVAIALTTLFFCWLARRSAVSHTWMLIACGICSLCALWTYAFISLHNVTVGLSRTPQWVRAAIPLLVVGAVYVLQRRSRQMPHLFKQAP